MTTSSSLDSSALISALHWRYATKAFDPGKLIPAETWQALEDTLILTPSSFGMQPWRFIVITDKELRAKLEVHSWGQTQVTQCSHYVVFAASKKIEEADIDALINRTMEVRGSTPESLQGFRGMLTNTLIQGGYGTPEWAARQVYIALGNFMTAAALLQIDTCPMEGFVPAEYDKILGLEAKGLASVVCCAAGYRNENDKYATLPKVRYAKEKVVESI